MSTNNVKPLSMMELSRAMGVSSFDDLEVKRELSVEIAEAPVFDEFTIAEPNSDLAEEVLKRTHQQAKSIEDFGDRLLADMERYCQDMIRKAQAAHTAAYDFAKAMRSGGDDVSKEMLESAVALQRATFAIEAARKEFQKSTPVKSLE